MLNAARWAIAAVLVSRAAGTTGSAECPCVDPFALSGVDVGNGTRASGSVRGSNAPGSPPGCALKGTDGTCFPETYGAGSCATHDSSLSTCTGGSPPEWCADSWCFVDPLNCARPYDPSTYFPDARLGESVHSPKLSYSYETCGHLNHFTDRAATTHVGLLKAFAAVRPIRVSFPGNSGSGYTLVTLGENEPALYTSNATGGTRRAGSMVEFGFSALTKYELPWEEVPISDNSRAYSPKSSFTACCHDVALGHTDICFANTWTTASRRSIVSFTSEVYSDSFLILTKASEAAEEGILARLEVPFLPFTYALWALIAAMCVVVGIAYWLVEGAVNTADFPERTLVEGLKEAAYRAFVGFVTAGDFRLTPVTKPGKLIFVSFSFCVLVLVSTYTAMVTTNLVATRTLNGDIKTFEEGLSKGMRFCGLQALQGSIWLRYPAAEALWVSVSTPADSLAGMDAGLCDAAVIASDFWQRHSSDLDANGVPHCTSKAALLQTVMLVANAMPVRAELQQALAWAYSAAQAEGVYEVARKEAIRRYLPRAGASCGTQETTQVGVASGGGTILLTMFIVCACVLYFLATEALRQWGLSTRTKEERLLEPPTVRERLHLSESAARKAAAKEAASVERSTAYQDDDIKVISQMRQARHLTNERLQLAGGGRPDDPLTLGDVPLLLRLVRHAATASNPGEGGTDSLDTALPEAKAPAKLRATFNDFTQEPAVRAPSASRLVAAVSVARLAMRHGGSGRRAIDTPASPLDRA